MRVLLLMAALDVASIGAEIDGANVRGDAGAIEISRSALREALAGGKGDETPYYRYALAYADYRLAMLSGRGTDESKRYLVEAEAELEELLKERVKETILPELKAAESAKCD